MTARSTSSILASKAGSDLKTHFSVSWNWFWWKPRNLELNGTRKNALQHLIDMFDSTDIQTAYVTAEQMVARMQKGFNGTNAVCIVFYYFQNAFLYLAWAVMSSMNLEITLMS